MIIKNELKHNKAIASFCASRLEDKRFMSFTLNTRISKLNASGTHLYMDKDEAKRAILRTFNRFRRALLISVDYKNYNVLSRYATFERGAYGNHPHIHGSIEIPYGLALSDARSLFMKYWIKQGWATHINHFVDGYTPQKWFDYVTKYKSEVLIY